MTHTTSLNNEALCTLMSEVEAILHSWPLKVELLSDGNSANSISPSNLLSMKSMVIMPPPGGFSRQDICCHKRWRRVQHIAEEFWSRWRKEFLLALQEQQRWSINRRNFQVGDIVLLKDDFPHRNHWPMAHIMETFSGKNGNVQNVSLKVGIKTNTTNMLLERPILKLVLILESGNT